MVCSYSVHRRSNSRDIPSFFNHVQEGKLLRFCRKLLRSSVEGLSSISGSPFSSSEVISTVFTSLLLLVSSLFSLLRICICLGISLISPLEVSPVIFKALVGLALSLMLSFLGFHTILLALVWKTLVTHAFVVSALLL